jgi:hypothetical protein
MTDLSTYEGRRAAWADELGSPDYEQYTGGALRSRAGGNGKKPCCCLGVACELIIRLEPGLLIANSISSTYLFQAVEHPKDGSSEFLPAIAAQWLGLYDTSPDAELDQDYVDAYRALNPIGVDLKDGAGDAGDQISLVSLNDAGVPFELIAGLIRRDRLLRVARGPVRDDIWQHLIEEMRAQR